MKTALIVIATFLGLLAASRAEAASILYSVTDLGTNPPILTDASGQDYGVTGSNGVTYAFDKAPVTKIDETTVFPGGEAKQVLTMQDGTYKVGYGEALTSGLSPYSAYPSFLFYSHGWDSANPASVVTDLNLQGQVIGQGLIYGTGTPYAAFSTVGAQSHDYSGNAAVVDNLNNYIASIPGVSLTSAGKIDDLGRIIAAGSNGDEYLLTPTALGPAATVPEPSTAALLGLAGSLLALRSLRHQWRR